MKELKYDNVDLVKALDYAKRDFECETDHHIDFGYDIEGKSGYSNYLSNESWTSFFLNISPLHRAQYLDGDGGELKEKKGRYGMNPPKMASFGSSSRFIYLLSKDIPCFSFEKQLPTRVGHTAFLDGFLEKCCKLYYVEAKCREIYGSHKNIKVSKVYEDVFNSITGLSFEYQEIKDDTEYRKYTFKYKGETLIHFDIKQLICHFLGISADILENRRSGVCVHFVYLIFNPNSETIFTEKTAKYKDKIINGYTETLEEIRLFNGMETLFNEVMKYQSTHLHLPEINCSFDFTCVDQNGYKSLFPI